MTICYLGIGSNIGNRRKNIKQALERIGTLKDTQVLKVSRVIESEPSGGPRPQGKFLNAALKIETMVPPHKLLAKLKTIEKELGRKNTVRWGPRTIDLDILFYGNRNIKTRALTVPHKRVFQREFVLCPLSEIIC